MQVVYGQRRVEFRELEADRGFQRLPEAVVAFGCGLPEDGVAFAFRDWKEFCKFAWQTPMAEKVARLAERRRKVRERKGENMTEVASRPASAALPG